MNLNVQCYAGSKADERPIRFQLGTHDYIVEEIVDQWHGPERTFFKLRADDGHLYILSHNRSVPDGGWSLESFREISRPSGE